jgi:uncharacterized protein YbjT (DUF2867 family)
MRIMVLGATGLIGSATCARLFEQGDEIVGVSRRPQRPGLIQQTSIPLDVARATTPEDWLPLLEGVDAVVNCAGTLQDAPGESTRGVHDRGIAALVTACERAGVRRFVHFSAVGVDRETPSAFSKTKQEGDAALMASKLDWVVLRPSVVIGRGAYGATALMRGLAALPVLPVMPDTKSLQLVHLEDVVETVVFFLKPGAPAREVLELVGPRRWSFVDTVHLFRRWMRWPPARELAVPSWIAGLVYKFGDAASLLGWRPPVRSTAGQEMRRGAVGDPGPWETVTRQTARDVEAMLAREPASVQERWFARMYLIKPLLFAVFGAFWIGTGLISLGPGWDHGMGLLAEGGLGETMSALAITAGALADIAIGIAILYRPTARYGLYAALAISITYAVVGSILVPRLWADPLGPMLKIWPIMVLNMVALAIREDR